MAALMDQLQEFNLQQHPMVCISSDDDELDQEGAHSSRSILVGGDKHLQQSHRLKIDQDSRMIAKTKKNQVAAAVQPIRAGKVRRPVIIHARSPKVIHAHPREFMWLVQSLTGSSETRSRCHEQSKMAPSQRRYVSSDDDDVSHCDSPALAEAGTSSSSSSSGNTANFGSKISAPPTHECADEVVSKPDLGRSASITTSDIQCLQPETNLDMSASTDIDHQLDVELWRGASDSGTTRITIGCGEKGEFRNAMTASAEAVLETDAFNAWSIPSSSLFSSIFLQELPPISPETLSFMDSLDDEYSDAAAAPTFQHHNHCAAIDSCCQSDIQHCHAY